MKKAEDLVAKLLAEIQSLRKRIIELETEYEENFISRWPR